MNILAYDTSSARLSAGVFENQNCLLEITSESDVRHSEELMPLLQKLLERTSRKLSDVDCLAVCLGPGSFTGLRVGISTAKMLAYTLKIKIAGVSTLEALAYEAAGAGHERIAVRMDARKSKVYGAVYGAKKEIFRILTPPSLVGADKFAALSKGAFLVEGDRALPNAARIARAAWPGIERKKFIDPFELQPLYLHPRDCNVTLKK